MWKLVLIASFIGAAAALRIASNPCDRIRCGYGASCVYDRTKGTASCVCNKMCTFNYAPVCGSDGKTYSNVCLLNVAACTTKTSISVAYQGECTVSNLCPSMLCIAGSTCVYDSTTGTSSCVCTDVCPAIYAPVCGSDGKTYSSDCTLNSVACNTKTPISVAYQGECTATASNCPAPSKDPVNCFTVDPQCCKSDSECSPGNNCCATMCGGTRCTGPVTETKPCLQYPVA